MYEFAGMLTYVPRPDLGRSRATLQSAKQWVREQP